MNRSSGGERGRLLLKSLFALASLYLFLVGIGCMSSGFKLLGSDFSKDLMTGHAGAVVSLFIGILATTLVQSSSTTTSLVVGLVAAGGLDFHSGIYMVMGANVGTTVTNTIVSLGHISRSAEYERAFAAATVHDFFNLIVLSVLFPLEVFTGVLDKLAEFTSDVFQDVGGVKLADPIKTITSPLIHTLKDMCSNLLDEKGGYLLIVVAFVLTFGALISLVKLLRAIMVARLENLFDRVLFSSPYRSLAFGLILTVFMQSSSITTSVAVPLVGAGVLSIHQIFPYTMGANVGTTMTALLAALAALAGAGPDGHAQALLGLHLAFHHVLFNVLGVCMLWPVRWLPIKIAEGFARLALWNRLVPIVYIIFTFYLLPFLVVWLGRKS